MTPWVVVGPGSGLCVVVGMVLGFEILAGLKPVVLNLESHSVAVVRGEAVGPGP